MSSENDEGVVSPDDDLSREGSEKRAKLRAEKKIKRKRISSQKPAATGINVLGNAIETLNTKEKIHDAVAKLNSEVLEKWTMLLTREVRKIRVLPSIGPLDLMNFEEFNALNRAGFVPFTPETYVVDVDKLMDRAIYEEDVIADLDVKSLHLKRERNARVTEKWHDFRFLRADNARKMGRIAEFSEFKRLKQSGVSVIDAKATWKEYNKTWYLLMGLKPSISSSEYSFQQRTSGDGDDDRLYGGDEDDYDV